jgi:hypothetical protein
MGFEVSSTASMFIDDRLTFVLHGHDLALYSRKLQSGSVNV